MAKTAPVVGLIMGSQSDWTTMRHAAATLEALGVAHEKRIVSAHRTPKRLFAYAEGAAGRGLKVIIAGAGGAAHLPGMVASLTALPVFGVPVESESLKGMDSLLSIVQMPALLAASVIALSDRKVAKALHAFRDRQTNAVADSPSDDPPAGHK